MLYKPTHVPVPSDSDVAGIITLATGSTGVGVRISIQEVRAEEGGELIMEHGLILHAIQLCHYGMSWSL